MRGALGFGRGVADSLAGPGVRVAPRIEVGLGPPVGGKREAVGTGVLVAAATAAVAGGRVSTSAVSVGTGVGNTGSTLAPQATSKSDNTIKNKQ